MALRIGTKAPDITIKTKNEDELQDVTLSDNFGNKKTVLLFSHLLAIVYAKRKCVESTVAFKPIKILMQKYLACL